MSDIDTPEFLLPELHAIIQNMIRQAGIRWKGLQERAAMRRVSRAWRARDSDFHWHKNHPDFANVPVSLRVDLYAVCEALQSLPFSVPCPRYIDGSGTLCWANTFQVEGLFYCEPWYTATHLGNRRKNLLDIAPVFSWWPGNILWVKKAHRSDGENGDNFILLPPPSVLAPLLEAYKIKAVCSGYTLINKHGPRDLILLSQCNNLAVRRTRLVIMTISDTGECTLEGVHVE